MFYNISGIAKTKKWLGGFPVWGATAEVFIEKRGSKVIIYLAVSFFFFLIWLYLKCLAYVRNFTQLLVVVFRFLRFKKNLVDSGFSLLS